MRRLQAAAFSATLCLAAAGAAAEPMTLDVVLSPKDEIRLAFESDGRHSLSLTHREGSAAGSGIFAGATVAEYGMHDVTGGEGGEAAGYLQATTAGGDIAYIKWRLRALFAAGPDGKAKVINGGHWELAGGTGQFAALRGVGTLAIEFPSKTERRYILQGDLSPAL